MNPLVQVAFDVPSTVRALAVLEAIADEVDIIEAGTVLCLSEGLGAVRALRAAHPRHPLVADIRIGRAGERFADLAFAAGASIVTVLGESPRDVVEGAVASAKRHGGRVEVELGESWTAGNIARWVDLGVASLIVHRPGGVAAVDDDVTRATLDRLLRLERGDMTVSLAGGLSPSEVRYFDGYPVDIVVVGSDVVASESPRDALSEFTAAARRPVGAAR